MSCGACAWLCLCLVQGTSFHTTTTGRLPLGGRNVGAYLTSVISEQLFHTWAVASQSMRKLRTYRPGFRSAGTFNAIGVSMGMKV
jgi:hypothetical protein